MTKVTLSNRKLRFTAHSHDDRKIGKGIDGFSLFLQESIKCINDSLGGYYFDKNAEIKTIFLWLNCNSNVTRPHLIDFFESKNEVMNYVFHMNFEYVIQNKYDLRVFAYMINSCLDLVFLDIGLSFKIIERIRDDIRNLARVEKNNYDDFSE